MIKRPPMVYWMLYNNGSILNDISILKNNIKPLQWPAQCYCELSCFDQVDSKLATIHRALIEYGLCLVAIKYSDTGGMTLQKIASHLGEIHRHDACYRAMWDIKSGGSHGHQTLARSHTMDEFLLHTDCSYEVIVPNFFGLQVIQHDRYGGGTNLLVDTHRLLQQLSQKTIEVLQTQPVKIIVPLEFKKNTSYIIAPVMDQHGNIRYRRDIIDVDSLTSVQYHALVEFETLVYSPFLLRSLLLVKNQILLLSNSRYLHARTKVLDKHRHLKRIRFFLKSN